MDIGLKIKEKRVAMGMSQLELAEGICTQGTISNIENRNTVPSTIILKDIARKLDLNFTDFGFKEDNIIKNVLEKVNKLVANGESEKAYYQLVLNLKANEISDDIIKKRYYYYLGNTCLIGLGDIEQAKEIFNNILENFEMSNTLDDILIFVGLGVSEVLSDNLKGGQIWIEKAVELLRNEILFKDSNKKEIMKIYFNIAKFYSQIENYKEAVRLSDEGIFWAKELGSSYHLDYLNYEKGFNLYKLGKFEEAKSYYNVSYVLATVLNNEIITKTILSDCALSEFNLDVNLALSMLEKY